MNLDKFTWFVQYFFYFGHTNEVMQSYSNMSGNKVRIFVDWQESESIVFDVYFLSFRYVLWAEWFIMKVTTFTKLKNKPKLADLFSRLLLSIFNLTNQNKEFVSGWVTFTFK